MSCTNLKISEMPFAHCLSGKELVPIVQNGENKVTTIDHLFPNPCDKPHLHKEPCKEWNLNWGPYGKGSWENEPTFKPHEIDLDLVQKAFSKAVVAQADSELALTKIQELNFELNKLRTDNFNMSNRITELERRLSIIENNISQNNG